MWPLLLQVRTLLKTQDSQSSVGSGFLVDGSGLLVTNYHVVEGAQEVRVTLDDGETYEAGVVGYDHVPSVLPPAPPGPAIATST